MGVFDFENMEKSLSSDSDRSALTAAQHLRIEQNKAKALSLRKAKLVNHPYSVAAKNNSNGTESVSSVIKVQGSKYIDSGGGFLIEAPLTSSQNDCVASGANGQLGPTDTVTHDVLTIPVNYEGCNKCGDQYVDSYLWNNFDYNVCDKCHDPNDEHALITRTDAKNEYLLKDCDLDKREPPLKYISRKNPHNVRWGEMKLYLRSQIHQRAMDIWGTEDELQRQHENRCEKRELGKMKKYNKQLKQLRMEVRSSLYAKETKGTHVHTFGEDTYNEQDDTYTHTCTICSFVETYEKM